MKQVRWQANGTQRAQLGDLRLARSTFGTNQLAETFGMVFMCKNVCAKPGEQGFFIGAPARFLLPDFDPMGV